MLGKARKSFCQCCRITAISCRPLTFPTVFRIRHMHFLTVCPSYSFFLLSIQKMVPFFVTKYPLNICKNRRVLEFLWPYKAKLSLYFESKLRYKHEISEYYPYSKHKNKLQINLTETSVTYIRHGFKEEAGFDHHDNDYILLK